jgi:CRISPR-associated exonuclease Cas4
MDDSDALRSNTVHQESPKYTGTQVNYYMVCHRKLWLFCHHLEMEQESDLVQLGKVIHETSYEREHKQIELEHIQIDWLDVRDGVLHEVKKDQSIEEAHTWQVLYYLYYLKSKGLLVQNSLTQSHEPGGEKQEDIVWKGEINYPKLKKRVEVVLTAEKEEQLGDILADIDRIITLPKPPPIEAKFSLCKKCSYCELCYS